MKAVEDTDAPDVIVGNFQIFDTTVHALIDLGSTHSYIFTDIPTVKNLPSSRTEYDIVDPTKTCTQANDTTAKGLLSNPRQRYHETC